MKKKQMGVIICMLLGLSLILTACGSGEKVRIGTAAEGGAYFALGNEMAELFAKDYSMNTEAKETAGSAANIRLISEDYLQLALAQSDMLSDAYHATGSFTGEKALKGYSAVAGLYTEVVQMVVLDQSEIQTPADLIGKTVSMGEAESGTQNNASQILLAYGISPEMLTEKNLNYQDATDALKNGDIDAMFCTAGVQTEILEKLAKSTPVRFLAVEDDKAAVLMDTFGFYNRTEIPAGTYTGQKEAVPALGVESILIASDEMSVDAVEKITEGVFKHAEELNDAAPVEIHLSEKTSVEGITIPFHEGAAAYYKKQGIEVRTEE